MEGIEYSKSVFIQPWLEMEEFKVLNPLDSLDLRELDETMFIKTLADAEVCIEKKIPQVTNCVELTVKDITQLVEGFLNDKELKEFKI